MRIMCTFPELPEEILENPEENRHRSQNFLVLNASKETREAHHVENQDLNRYDPGWQTWLLLRSSTEETSFGTRCTPFSSRIFRSSLK